MIEEGWRQVRSPQCFVLLFIYYFASSKVFASSNSGIIQLHNENSAIEGENSENVQNQNSEALPDESTEGNQNHASNIDDPSLTHESVHQDNAVPTNELPTNSRENDDSSESAPAVAETDEPNIFAPVIIDELEVSSPVELNDARSLTHHHMVMQSAAVAAESSLLLLLRVSRALLAIMENYKSELEEMVQLLQYKAALLRNSGGAAQHSHALQQVTDALVVARAKEQSWEQQYKDGCLLMRVAHHSSDSAQLCAHIAGAEQDAMAVAAAVTALRPKIEQLQQEIRSLRSDVRTQHVEVIRSEQEGRRETRSPANAALD
ncbi:hypothetical protein FHG87_007843 [Trinorchestia longiramus]|nr:hypothetical protein FHG87_007843 [Trinorchestia longiramus]